MGFNRYIDTMTIWAPNLDAFEGPKYHRLAEAIAGAVKAGELAPGARLPTHRELARALGVTVGTVSRAYEEARHRGLIAGEVGRGTFVKDREASDARGSDLLSHGSSPEGATNLAVNLPVRGDIEARLTERLMRFAEQPGAAWIYQSSGGTEPQRTAGAEWLLASAGLETSPSEVVVTNGAQQAILVALSAVARSGDVVLASALTYPGVESAARWLGLRLEPVRIDEHGMVPESLDEACRRIRPRAVFLMPSVHNPTAVTMPAERRQAVLEITAEHDVDVIEDDTYRFLAQSPSPPLAALGGPRIWYVTTLSKSVAPGLRIAFLRAPEGETARARDAVQSTTWTANPLTAELSRAWIEDGTAAEVASWRLEESMRRRRIARRFLSEFVDFERSSHSLHLWIETPEPWRAADFVDAARGRGVLVTSPEPFVVGRSAAPHAVRVCLGPAHDDESLETGLAVIAGLLRDPEGAQSGGLV